MIVLLQPPFFRLAGSHNDRLNLNLAYASTFLTDANIDHVVVNADWAGSTSYVPWRDLFFEHDRFWMRACDGDSPLYAETLEMVMQYRPDTVVIAAGDDVIPTKNTGSPWTAAIMARKLRPFVKRIVGIGPVFTKVKAPFDQSFDELFPSMMNRSFVDIVMGEQPPVLTGAPLGVLPSFDKTHPACSTDYVMSTFGCTYECSFCWAPKVLDRQILFQPLDTFVEDVERRIVLTGSRKLYVADMIFPLSRRRVEAVADRLEPMNLELSCECRVDLITAPMVEALRRCGVTTVKLGIEAITDATLTAMHKKQTVNGIEESVRLLRAGGMKVVGYLIFGSFYANESAMWETIERVKALELDYVVVNVESYQKFTRNQRYDAHFSLESARRMKIPEKVLEAALDLQSGRPNPTTAAL